MANPTKTTFFALAATAALVTACGGGSSYHPTSPKGGYAADEPPPASEPGSDAFAAGQPGPEQSAAEAASEEGADFGPAPASKSARPSPSDFDDAAPQRELSPGSGEDPFSLQKPRERPGLATQWGERRFSRVTTAPFVRADRLHPFAVSTLFYNDPQGIAAMTDTRGSVVDHMRRFPVGSGHVEMGLRDGSGRFLTGFQMSGDNFVTGVAGHRYTIVIKNHSPGRIEAVVSVDGLDVIDGKDASFRKRGYLIDPFGDLEIDGWRTNTEEVAAFRFGSVSSSYSARKHGKTRNVGVIGLAVFHERGDSPRFWGTPRGHQDVVQRRNANPFPDRFASPPN